MFNKSLEEILCQDFLLQKNLKKMLKQVNCTYKKSSTAKRGKLYRKNI